MEAGRMYCNSADGSGRLHGVIGKKLCQNSAQIITSCCIFQFERVLGITISEAVVSFTIKEITRGSVHESWNRYLLK